MAKTITDDLLELKSLNFGAAAIDIRIEDAHRCGESGLH